ncbi:AAA family ATPase [Streptomyces sp. NPDC058642]|uniref:AAA family ATPase n=1 Tax=Streptomyces sp. NPDC058642 TaxID=3346572 RepID=UPI00365C953B
MYRLYLQAGPPTLREIFEQIETLAEDLGKVLARPGVAGDVEELVDRLVGAAPSKDTIHRILGAPVLPPGRQDTVAVAVALALMADESRPDVVAAEVRRYWDRAADEVPDPPDGGSRHSFNHLLMDHTEKFAGREGEIRAILNYVDRHDRGYIFVDGLSGYGKTSLLATLVKRQPSFLYHFISQRYKTEGSGFDPTLLEHLLSNLVRQLEPNRSVPSDGFTLTERWDEALAAERECPTVLVLDAIDEVDRHPSFLLGRFPQRLPRNLFILLSARSQGDRSYLAEVGLRQDHIDLKLTLGGLDAGAVRDLLLHHAGTAGAALGQHADFVDALHDVSEGDPFYLRFLVEDVEKGHITAKNIEQTPFGLYQYLDEQFEQLHRSVDTALHDQVLALILEAYGPLHRSDLLDIIPGLTGGALGRVLRDVQRFLLFSGPRKDWITFCHNRFKEYFREKR